MSAWIGVASADHVGRGRQGGFMQVCHGKGGPLSRIKPGDHVFYYSPSTTMGGGVALQAITAAGRVRDGVPYPFDMGDGFVPYRRDVDWLDAKTVPIRPLLDALELTRGRAAWGAVFRFGIVKISEHDCKLLLHAMQARQGR
ncbi:EVE domain-containing protein [Rhizobium sp. KVB221]|uniref:UPF0310 protein JJB09_09395 n=1 Tax=Rhizobium setariae TaxID=2801340 RepID=A0A936YQA0_9HYPH|nr:EVE domain-containing protein [Rhizobium setariae]MBL0372244.1 EVE domain-containing protein [Rhizobium setariae]